MALDTVEEKILAKVETHVPSGDWRVCLDGLIAKCRNGSKRQKRLVEMKGRIEAQVVARESQEADEILEDEQPGSSLAAFIEEWQDAITGMVIETYQPQYQPTEDELPLPSMLRQPMGRQEEIIRGAALSLGVNRGTTIVGEMGVGKTFVGIVAAFMAGFKRVIVLVPPHLTGKWKREIEMTLSSEDVAAVVVNSITDLQRIGRHYGTAKAGDPRALFVVVSRERAKLSYQWENVAHWSLPISRHGLLTDDDGNHLTIDGSGTVYDDAGHLLLDARERLDRLPICPDCSQPITDKVGVPLTGVEVQSLRHRLVCFNVVRSAVVTEDGDQRTTSVDERICGAQLWCATNGGRAKARIGLAEYISKKMRHFFDLFIADEVHEYKAKHSAQGLAAAALANVCGKSLVLTGTLMGGYSSTLFYLLYRFYPEFRDRFDYSGESQWIQQYGFYEETIRLDAPDVVIEHGKTSRRKGTNKKTIKEKPGLLPGALFHLIENSLFLRLSDVASDLPPYDEHILTVGMDQVPDATGFSQQSAYNYLFGKIYAAMVEALQNGSQRLLATYLQTLLAYPDGCTKGEECYDPLFKWLIVAVPPLVSNKEYPKEVMLKDLVAREKAAGRRVLVYVTHTETRDITGRVRDVLRGVGIKASILKSGNPKSEAREEWVAEEVRNGADALICNPKLVQTGLDLIDFPTIVWYETEYSVYTMRQASRRSWRIGQTNPVAVYYMTYQGCLQSDALALVAAKMQSSLAVEGELPEEGLSAYGDSSDNLMITLARQITGWMRRREVTAADIEAQFRKVRSAEVEGDALLVRVQERPNLRPEPPKAPVEPSQPPEPPPTPELHLKRRRNGHREAAEVPAKTPPPAKVRRKDPLLAGQLPMFALDDFR